MCGSSKISIDYLKTFQGILNIIVMVLVFAGIAVNGNLASLGFVTSSLLETTSFVDLKPCADLYEMSFIIQSLAFFVIIVRLATTLAKNSRVYLIITTFETTGLRLMYYFVIYTPVIIAFSIVAMYIWGTNWGDYSSLYRAIITTLMFTVGQIDRDIIQDPSVNTSLAIVYATIFYFFVISFFAIVFRGILIEGYRIMMLDYGHSFHERTWVWREYVKWFFSWIPNRVINSVEERAKRYQKKLLAKKKKPTTNQA
jgi:hypothetical protein